MIYVWLVILILFNACWLMLVPFTLPGNWLMIITTVLFAWWQRDSGVFSIYTLAAITALAVVGEILEFLGGMGGARKAGASWRGSLGAIIGAIVGAIFLVASDTLARVIIAPAQLPVGVVTAIVGGPFFLILLVKYSRKVGWLK